MTRCDECHRTSDSLAEVSADRDRIRDALRVLIHATEGPTFDAAALAAARRSAMAVIASDTADFVAGMMCVFNRDVERERNRRNREVMNRE